MSMLKIVRTPASMLGPVSRVGFAALIGLAGLACNGSKPAPQTGPKAPHSETLDRSRCAMEGKRVVELDLNRDNQPDVWNIYAKKKDRGTEVDVLACKAIDLNFDGRVDMWKYYDDDGNLTREEMDLDFDGRIDVVSFRSAGKIVRQEMDTNYDGKTDIWKHYEDGVLVRVERDSSHDGKVDYWEHYVGGELDRIGYDRDGDGKVDDWDRAPSRGSASSADLPTEGEPAEGEPAEGEPAEGGEERKGE